MGHVQLELAYLNQAQTPSAQHFDEAIQALAVDPGADKAANQDKILKLKTEITSVDRARQAIIDGDLNGAIVVPESFGMANGGEVVLLVDESDTNFSSVLTRLVDGI